jgi:hypothetical protein
MKKFVAFLWIAFCASCFVNSGLAQSRSAGQLVVPFGYETFDSVRYMLIDLNSPANPPSNAGQGRHYIDSLADRLGATFEGAFGTDSINVALNGKRKGIMARDGGTFPFSYFIIHTKQRAYSALPSALVYRYSNTDPLDLRGNNGYFWHYNDASGINPLASVHNNTYDANDISPYCEYPKNSTIVNSTFHTRRFNAAIDSNVRYGDEGRVILGMSDDRSTKQMMQTMIAQYLPAPGHVADTAKMFSLNLDFNIESGIDTSLSNLRDSLDLPLVRLQVLFKKGKDNDGTSGWATLPMVPFQDLTHPKDSCWFKVIDTLISKRTYDALDTCWRARDTLQSGGYSHPWNFKQLHLQLSSMSSLMRAMITPDTGSTPFLLWGHGAADTTTIKTFVHPDSLVDANTRTNRDASFLEIRVLSTYRATIRVRGMTFQDTLVDRFLYRKRSGGTTYSCNQDGTRGIFDSLLNLILPRFGRQPYPCLVVVACCRSHSIGV